MATLFGSVGDDVFYDTSESDYVYGLSGRDTFILTGFKSQYSISSSYDTYAGTRATIFDLRGGGGIDTLRNVEVLQFVDGILELDRPVTPVFPSFPTINHEPSSPNLTGPQTISELAPIGTEIGRLTSTDMDGDTVTFRLTNDAGGTVRLDGDRLILNKALDYETARAFIVGAEAVDSHGASSYWPLLIDVVDELEHVNSEPFALRSSPQTVSEGLKAGSRLGVLTASDPDGDALSYELIDDANGALSIVNGNTLVLSKAVDYEILQNLRYVVSVSDGLGGIATATFNLRVTDVAEVFKGTARNDKITTAGGVDELVGLAGNDVLSAGAGADKLNGGLGADSLYGGVGNDIFQYRSQKDSYGTAKTQDTIFDFQKYDRIDLSDIDAKPSVKGDQAFTFIGNALFHGKAGEVRFEKLKSDTYIYADTNGDRVADLTIHLDDAMTLNKGMFIL